MSQLNRSSSSGAQGQQQGIQNTQDSQLSFEQLIYALQQTNTLIQNQSKRIEDEHKKAQTDRLADQQRFDQLIQSLQGSQNTQNTPRSNISNNPQITPTSSNNQNQQNSAIIQAPFVQQLPQAKSMSKGDSIENYLAYFQGIYETWQLNDQQKVVFLVDKLPSMESRYVQSLLKEKLSFDQVKEQLLDQFGTSQEELLNIFNCNTYKSQENILQFIMLCQHQLEHVNLPQSVKAYEIYKKLPIPYQRIISIEKFTTVQELNSLVKKVKEASFLSLYDLSISELNSTNLSLQQQVQKPNLQHVSQTTPILYNEISKAIDFKSQNNSKNLDLQPSKQPTYPESSSEITFVKGFQGICDIIKQEPQPIVSNIIEAMKTNLNACTTVVNIDEKSQKCNLLNNQVNSSTSQSNQEHSCGKQFFEPKKNISFGSIVNPLYGDIQENDTVRDFQLNDPEQKNIVYENDLFETKQYETYCSGVQQPQNLSGTQNPFYQVQNNIAKQQNEQSQNVAQVCNAFKNNTIAQSQPEIKLQQNDYLHSKNVPDNVIAQNTASLQGFCELADNFNSNNFQTYEPYETLTVNTRAQTQRNREQEPSCNVKQEEPPPVFEQFDNVRQRKRQHYEYQANEPQQNERTQYNVPQGQPQLNSQYVLTEKDVVDGAGKVNLSGLFTKIQICLPFQQYLSLNNMKIVQAQAGARPVNIYSQEVQQEQQPLQNVQQEYERQYEKISNDVVTAVKTQTRAEKMIVPIMINNVVLDAIIDTGAEHTIITTSGVYKCNLNARVNKTTDQVRGLTGIQSLFGYLRNQRVTLGQASFNVDIAVYQENMFDVLLGRDILIQIVQHLVLNTKKCVLEFEFQGKPHVVQYQNRAVGQVSQGDDYAAHAFYCHCIYSSETTKWISDIQSVYKHYPYNYRYNFFLIDPPLEQPVFHNSYIPYNTQSIETLQKLPIKQQAMADSLCLLWSSGKMLQDSLILLVSWGFKFSTVLLVWGKNSKTFQPVMGLGYWTRSNVEFLLLGKKGKVSQFKSDLKNIRQGIFTIALQTVRGKHSEKPEEVYQIIKQIFNVGAIQGIEIFARSRNCYNDYLDIYGDQIPGYFQSVTQETTEIDVSDTSLERETNLCEILPCNNNFDPIIQGPIYNNHIIKPVIFQSLQNVCPSQSPKLFQDKSSQKALNTINYKKQQFLANKIVGCSKQAQYYVQAAIKNDFSGNVVKLEDIDILRLPKTHQPALILDSSVSIAAHSKINAQLRSLNIPEKYCTTPILNTFLTYLHLFGFNGKYKATNILKHVIVLKKGAKPVKQKQYRLYNEVYKAFVAEQVSELLKEDLIFPVISDWVSPIVIVPKKGGKLRMCIDFKLLNDQTLKDRYPFPFIEEIVINLVNKTIFAVLDLLSGYWQVLMDENSVLYTTFTCFLGTFACRRMQFGLTNAVATFQRLMNEILKELIGICCFVYIDDIVIYAESPEELTTNLAAVFECIQRADLTLSPTKCVFFTDKIQLLGQVIENNVMKPQPAKLEVLQNLREPRTVKEVQKLLGLVNYFRKYLPSIASLTYPLQLLCTKKDKWIWGETQQKSFESLKELLKSDLQLKLPNPRFVYIVQLSFNNIAYGGVLSQRNDNDIMVPVQYLSKLMPGSDMKLSQHEKEIRALIRALTEWEPFLTNRQFIVETDSQAINWVQYSSTKNNTLFSYRSELGKFSFSVEKKSPSKLIHLQALLTLNREMSWVDHMDDMLTQAEVQKVREYNEKNIAEKPVLNITWEKYDYVVFFDGACASSKKFGYKCGAAACVILDTTQKVIFEKSCDVQDNVTNNYCEYQGLKLAIMFLQTSQFYTKRLLVIGDSQLVINQLKNVYACNNENLRSIYLEMRQKLRQFKNLTLQHVFRADNNLANHLAQTRVQRTRDTQIDVNKTTHGLSDIQVLEVLLVQQENELERTPCEVCQQRGPQPDMLLCDHCGLSFHFWCVGLEHIPVDDWFCEPCQIIMADLNINDSSVLDPIENQNLWDYLRDNDTLQGIAEDQRDALIEQAQHFSVINNRMYFASPTGLRFIPKVGERDLIIKQVHQAFGHYGYIKTLDLVRQHYWWPKIAQRIRTLIKTCLICQSSRPQFSRTVGISHALDKGNQPFTYVSLDLTYLPESDQRFRYCIVAVCSFCKWPEAGPLVERDADTVWQWFMENVIARYGAPAVVRTDQGNEFLGTFHEMLQRHGILHVIGSPNYPQTQGQVEKMNDIIKLGLRRTWNTLEYQQDWPKLLPTILLAIRTSISRATGFSPSKLLMGRDLRLPGHNTHPTPLRQPNWTPNDYEAYFQELQATQGHLYNEIQVNLERMNQEIITTIDNRRKRLPDVYQQGDQLIMKHEPVDALELPAEGPLYFLDYTDDSMNAIHYYNPRTNYYGKASIANIKLLHL